jgi:ligand-binding SRPBCC domain-containing protein
MPVLRIVTEMPAPVETCFDLSRSIDLHLESMITSKERAVAGVTSGLISGGEEVTWEARHLGRLWRMTSRITVFEPPHMFVDEMVKGPFGAFRHEHRLEPHGGGTRMTDVVRFRMAGACSDDWSIPSPPPTSGASWCSGTWRSAASPEGRRGRRTADHSWRRGSFLLGARPL